MGIFQDFYQKFCLNSSINSVYHRQILAHIKLGILAQSWKREP